jgi:hypothetical protein
VIKYTLSDGKARHFSLNAVRYIADGKENQLGLDFQGAESVEKRLPTTGFQVLKDRT